MHVRWIVLAIAFAGPRICCAQTEQPLPPDQLVREVVYNELHDHQSHGYWRYWIERHTRDQTRIEQQVETADGPVTRLTLSNGRALDPDVQQQEEQRLNLLLSSPAEQARHRKEFVEDENRIGRILALLPDAFLFEYADTENGCYHLRFRPNPNYPAHSIEARIFHAMTGQLWIDIRYKHLARLDGQLQENVDFGYGILGRLYKGGWFCLQRTRVSATDWKTERLEIHMSGRALLFKTIARETSEMRGDFVPVPAALTLAQGMMLLNQHVAQNGAPATLQIKQAAFAALP